MKKIIEYASLITAMVASVMLALHVPFAGWAFILYLLSNLTSLYVMRGTNTPRVIVYQILFFTVVNMVGVKQWLIDGHVEEAKVECVQTK
jgi:membrane-associated HD superfamily phosphohydrolase